MPAGTPDAKYADYTAISKSVYLDKTTAGFVSQIVGMLSGYEYVKLANGRCRVAMPDEWFELCNGPYAGNDKHTFQMDKLLLNKKTGIYETWIDDDFSVDIFNQYTIEKMLSEHGTIVSKSISDSWIEYGIWDMGGGQRKAGAYGLISRNGYLPQFAGSCEFGNWYSFLPEPYISTDTLGFTAAAMPNTAAYLADTFSAVTGDRDNTEWARMFATMLSLAYTESNIEKLIYTAADTLSRDSFAYSIVEEVFALHEKYPTDWRKAYTEFENKYYIDEITLAGNTTINCGFVLLDLLYGGGDYLKTAQIGSLAGYDCETTCGIALSVLALMGGTKVIPDVANELVWQGGNGVIVNLARTSFADDVYMHADNLPKRIQISEIVDMFTRNFESVLLANGGHIDSEYYYIPKQTIDTYKSVKIENSGFESGSLDVFGISGKAEISLLASTGRYAAKLYDDGEITATVHGLTVGKTYELSAFIAISDKSSAYLFARDKENAFSAAVYRTEGAAAYESQKGILRKLVFTATSPDMEIGIRFIPNMIYSGEHAIVDAFTLYEISETKVGNVTVTDKSSDGIYTNSVNLKVNSDRSEESLLKVSFANLAPAFTNVSLTVNGVAGGTAAFSATGIAVLGFTPLDCVYIPVMLAAGENTITLSFSGRELIINDVQLVKRIERW